MNRADIEEVSKGLDHSKITNFNLHGKDEPLDRLAVGAPLTLPQDRKRTLTGDEAGERKSARFRGADPGRTGDLLDAIQALYQLSYGPGCEPEAITLLDHRNRLKRTYVPRVVRDTDSQTKKIKLLEGSNETLPCSAHPS